MTLRLSKYYIHIKGPLPNKNGAAVLFISRSKSEFVEKFFARNLAKHIVVIVVSI